VLYRASAKKKQKDFLKCAPLSYQAPLVTP
jgi:hypothetical protein